MASDFATAEAGCDLARLAGCSPSAVICEVMAEDGTMARGERVTETARLHDLPLVSVEDLVLYRSLTGDTEVTTTQMPARHGDFTATVWASENPGRREIVTLSSLPIGEELDGAPLVHLHSECLTGEAFGSHRCDCGSQLKAALEGTGREPGVLVYLRQEGRRIGLVNKLRAYSFQDGGLDTVEANVELGHRPDERSYAAATAVLRKLGLERVRLITNNPDKYEAVRCSGIRAQRVALGVGRHPADESYIAAKALRMGQRVAAARL